MKNSIKKIFSDLSLFLFLTTAILIILILLIIEQRTSFTKITILQNQKKTLSTLSTLSTINNIDIELALIQLDGKSNQLNHEIEKLKHLEEHNYVGRYLSSNSDEYLENLDRLSKLTIYFNKSVQEYYTRNPLDEVQKTQKLKDSFDTVNSFLDSMTMKSIVYAQHKQELMERMAFISLALLITISFWYRRILNSIYEDILYLYSIDKQRHGYKFFSIEADAVQLRMNRKSIVIDDPSLKDPLTEINNYKGMMSSYKKKNNMNNNNVTSVTVFEIDNFSKNKKTFSKSFIEVILKKITYTLSLNERATDIIARTEYNQFTVILSRSSLKTSFKDIDIIRQSISELKFKLPNEEPLVITVSGGFAIKPNNQPLEDSIKKAKVILAHAQTKKNTISQTMNLAEQ